MAPPSLLASTVFRRTLAVVLLLALTAGGVIGLVGWNANAIMTGATSRLIEGEVAELRNEFRARGIEALVVAVAERSRVGTSGLYRLENAAGHRQAGNLEQIPDAFAGGRRAGTFLYHPLGAPAGAMRTAAGVLIDIDAHSLLVVARDIEEQRALLQAIYRSVGLGALMLLVLGLGGSFFLSRHVLGRIDEMGRASADIMAGDFARRIPIDGSGDELDRLAGRLNEMLSRIEQLMAGLREVSDNIAHDLRTPLNRLRNRAEQALADSRGGEAWQEGLERVIDEADELIKTFNALLLIARLEAGSQPDGAERLDLGPVIEDLVELYEPVAEEAGSAISCRVDRPLVVTANRQLIGQALTNLIDNALKYGGNGTITVTAASIGGDAVVAVADRGVGIRPEDRERALRRFVRLDKSRTKAGTGLGLSLVAAVARMHGGSVRLEDNEPGLRVVLTIPLAASTPPVAGSVPVHSGEKEATRA